MDHFSSYKVDECPPTVYYVPDFITEQEEKYFLDQVYKCPKTKWTVLSNRRLQNWGGIPQAKCTIQELLPKWLEDCCSKVDDTGAFESSSPNHVLINEYKPGQGILPHLDGPLYYPTISTISLGAHTVINFYDAHKSEFVSEKSDVDTGVKYSLYLERRSLLILKDEMYTSYMHGIEDIVKDDIQPHNIANLVKLGDREFSTTIESSGVSQDRGTRVSLTIRHVPNAKKLKLQFGKRFR